MPQAKIVLMACGSYSPPTYMHLRMFEIAKDHIQSLGIGTVIGGIISPVHDAYGKKDLVAAHHRIAMLKLALRSSPWIKVSEWETEQNGWTRTRVSMQYHQDKMNECVTMPPGHSVVPDWVPDDVTNVNCASELNGNLSAVNVSVKLLCGADLLESFATPGLWSDEDMEAIVGRFGLVVVSRAGNDPGRFVFESDMLHKYRKNIIHVTNYVTNEVSSTMLRRLVRRKLSAKYLTDDRVIDYIHSQGLYQRGDTDRPSIIDETITVKRPRKSNYLLPNAQTDSVSPSTHGLKPKMAYIDQVPASYVPGKAVKIVSDATQHKIQDEKVSQLSESTYSSLDSYLTKDELSYEIYKRRVSEGNVDSAVKTDNVKKRCSSTIRKLNPDDVKKSRSEVSKLCEKMKNIKMKESSGRNYKTRSCNDIVRLILTKHGIHVISDTEAIV